MKFKAVLSVFLAAVLATSVLSQDELLGKKRGGGSGGHSSGGSSGGGGKSSGGGGNSSGGSSGGGHSSGGSSGGGPSNPIGRSEPPPAPVRQRDGTSGGTIQRAPAGSSNSGWTRSDNQANVDRPKSRVGDARYGSSNNRFDPSRTTERVTVREFPQRSEAARKASREEIVARNRRSGYYMYDPRWRDDYFVYPHYRFSYSPNSCAPSPWYLYPHLPAYVPTNRISFSIGIGSFSFNTSYAWRYSDRYDRNSTNYDLDLAIRDLVDAFERNNLRALDNLVPRRGSVVISNDRERSYSLNSDDFYDMMVDAVRGTRTERYRILDVRQGRDCASVVASHEFRDAWGQRDTVYHSYTLQYERRGYVIVEFGTSYRRP